MRYLKVEILGTLAIVAVCAVAGAVIGANFGNAAFGDGPANNVLIAREIRAESIHLKHPGGKYAMTLAVRPTGAWIVVIDGKGRELIVSLSDKDSGIYGKQKHALCYSLGKADGDPVLMLQRTDNAPIIFPEPNGRVVGEKPQ